MMAAIHRPPTQQEPAPRRDIPVKVPKIMALAPPSDLRSNLLQSLKAAGTLDNLKVRGASRPVVAPASTPLSSLPRR